MALYIDFDDLKVADVRAIIRKSARSEKVRQMPIGKRKQAREMDECCDEEDEDDDRDDRVDLKQESSKPNPLKVTAADFSPSVVKKTFKQAPLKKKKKK